MGKRSKKRQRAVRQELADMREFIMDQIPQDRHVMPIMGRMHMPAPWCICQPVVQYTHPLTEKKVYLHVTRIH